MKKLLPKIGIGFAVIFIILLLTQKDRMMEYASGLGAKQKEGIIDPSLNFTLSDNTYSGSFLEFGAGNCVNCKRMIPVISEIETKYSDKVFIKNYNITVDEGLHKSKMFGVISVPMQILLNKKGEIVYKHFGYIAADELAKLIDNKILNNP